MDSIYLQGSEDVLRASSSMREAASTMSTAASSIDWALQQHQRFLDDWLQRLEFVVQSLNITQLPESASARLERHGDRP